MTKAIQSHLPRTLRLVLTFFPSLHRNQTLLPRFFCLQGSFFLEYVSPYCNSSKLYLQGSSQVLLNQDAIANGLGSSPPAALTVETFSYLTVC